EEPPREDAGHDLRANPRGGRGRGGGQLLRSRRPLVARAAAGHRDRPRARRHTAAGGAAGGAERAGAGGDRRGGGLDAAVVLAGGDPAAWRAAADLLRARAFGDDPVLPGAGAAPG